ncbi:hypothetical protein TBLA_0I02090 [Henningerozyma blattae CBS 6284]|uniref:Vesicular-fusion protein SEC18 n=1 Tax=Henningerozyma blattae (strain ATCC 34711 / CBS 6284 / DSM 70876 / NBRC 10599 / NRRL Y-10934 / UCD 77-7) TaxID=1071380 RepID=I2H915_HENB6|nr:hypothetical protein TBLA_0I02090 [Tetrapisispora blattae CBS 6284]CCH62867.1 hypothetical protein TBLA_0I02090 [Tetrapisispora blattae CBS 6284]
MSISSHLTSPSQSHPSNNSTQNSHNNHSNPHSRNNSFLNLNTSNTSDDSSNSFISRIDSKARYLQVINCPNNNYALTNVVTVNNIDFPDNVYIIIDNTYVFTTKTTNEVPPGSIGFNGNQRTWGKWNLNQPIECKIFDMLKYTNKQNYIGLINIDINFRTKSKAVPQEFDPEELSYHFKKLFHSQILQPTQYLIFDFNNFIFDLKIESIQPIDISDVEIIQPISRSIQTKGILTNQSEINFIQGRDGLVNLKRSNSISSVFKTPTTPTQNNNSGGSNYTHILNHHHSNSFSSITSNNSKHSPSSLLHQQPHQSQHPSSPRSGKQDAILRPDFKFEDLGVGGLDKEFTKIFRRAFASRIFPQEIIEKLGIKHVKGLLLYGPPGTGKTLIARKIGTMLNAKEPKIVNGPEILSKYVGSSEENIRNLFKDAEEEYRAKGDNSSLHIIIFDELDSIFKQRGSRGDGTGVGDNVVNQLLAKMDGVDQLNNILVIGMTNRKDLIDGALLRPGRFEVQVEIHLPDVNGRVEIFEIQTKKMRENNLMEKDVNFRELSELTNNFSGAEIEGLVKSASSFAINKTIKIGKGAKINNNNLNKEISKFKVGRSDFLNALTEVKPAFGINEEELNQCCDGGILNFSENIGYIIKNGDRYVRQIRESSKTRLISILLHGPSGSGKTAMAARIAMNSKFPFVRLISSNELIGMGENSKIQYIDNIFRDSYKSPLSIIIVDSIETMVDWVPIGPRFSNNLLQMFKVLLKKKPIMHGNNSNEINNKLLIITTTSKYTVLKEMDLLNCFDNEISVPNVKSFDEFNNIMALTNFLNDEKRVEIINELVTIMPHQQLNCGIKKILTNIETAIHDEDPESELIDLMANS